MKEFSQYLRGYVEKEGILKKNINSGKNTVCFPAQITDGHRDSLAHHHTLHCIWQ